MHWLLLGSALLPQSMQLPQRPSMYKPILFPCPQASSEVAWMLGVWPTTPLWNQVPTVAASHAGDAGLGHLSLRHGHELVFFPLHSWVFPYTEAQIERMRIVHRPQHPHIIYFSFTNPDHLLTPGLKSIIGNIRFEIWQNSWVPEKDRNFCMRCSHCEFSLYLSSALKNKIDIRPFVRVLKSYIFLCLRQIY